MKEIRLGSTLNFDEVTEKDIINIVEGFSAKHKLGEFISHLIRIAVENPELLCNNNGTWDTGSIIKDMEKVGMYPTRKSYIQNCDKAIACMQSKVDEIYNMCYDMHIYSRFSDVVGFKEQEKNMFIAEIILEKQLKKLKDALGVDMSCVPFESDKIRNMEESTNNAVAYILEKYSNVLDKMSQQNSNNDTNKNNDNDTNELLKVLIDKIDKLDLSKIAYNSDKLSNVENKVMQCNNKEYANQSIKNENIIDSNKEESSNKLSLDSISLDSVNDTNSLDDNIDISDAASFMNF